MKIFDLDLLQLGITNLCNNNCIMCHQSKEWFKPSSKGSMNFNHAKKIIDDIYDKNIKFKVLHLFWKGEPFLNPDFLAILKYIMDKNNNNILFENLYINTNGTLLKDREEEFIDILNSNENVSVTVNFSIDACYVETYLKIRGKDYLSQIENSLKILIKLREENKLKNPLFIFQIVIQKLNADEVNDFVNKWQNELSKFNKKADFTYFLKAFENDVIFFRPLQPENEISRKSWLKAIKNYLPEDYEKLNETHIARIHANEVKKAEMPCFHLWKTPIIDWDGKVTACCGDFNCNLLDKFNIRLKDKDFSDIWFGEEMNELRKLSYSGKYSEMPEICSKCFMYLEMTEEFRVFLEKWALDNNLPVLFHAEKTESDDKDELINIANMKIEQGDYEKAEDLLKKVSKEFSEDEKLLSAFISLYNKKNDFKKTIDISEKLYEKTSKIRYLEEKAHSLFMLKEFEKSYKIYRFLYRKERKPVYLSALIDLQYSLKNEKKIRAIIKYFSLFSIKNSDYDFVYKLADFFYFYFLFNKKNSQKSWKDLCRYLFKNDILRNKETFRKFFYIKRKFDFYGADYLFAEVLIKNRNILDEKMVIELVYFEMEKSDFDKNWVIYILTEFIKTELYFALEIYEKLELNKSEILQRLIEINEREKNIHSSFIKTYLKNNKMHRELFVFSIKKIFNL